MAEHHPLKPFYSVLVLAFGCSLLVAVAAVGLKPIQETNKELDRKKNILAAAGIYQKEIPIEKQFTVIETRLVDLNTGAWVDETKLSPATYDQRGATHSDTLSIPLTNEQDIAGIGRREHYSLVYLVKKNGTVDRLVLPVRGKGLWSTMFAYVSLDSDLSTIKGVSFYEHGETPGLGGEVENPKWQGSWQDRKVYTPDGTIAFALVKDRSRSEADQLPYTIDGISGATLTSQGVEQLMHFWFGQHGFKPFIDRVRKEGGING